MENLERLKKYRGITVLITGHTGFKGAWLSIWLHHLGAKVIGFSLDKHDNDAIYSQIKNKGIFYADEKGDIRNYKEIRNIFEKYGPDIVFHLAAQALVRESYKEPKFTFETNVLGTVNVLECIKESKNTKSAIIITTDKCYKNKEQIWPYREKDELGGYDPYSCSKACAELIIACYRNSFLTQGNKLVSSVRAGNVIGGGDWAKDRIIPDCIKALLENKNIAIRNPDAVRPWQHVIEPLYGYLLIGTKLMDGDKRYDEAFNFGPKFESVVPVKKIADLIIKNWGFGEWVDVHKNNENLHEATLLNLDITKSMMLLSWKPIFSIEESIKNTIDWYKNNKDNNAYELCIKQIKDYENKILK